ncbi:MAG: prepilin peptidase [Kiritimatiellaceae bacterium]|nr:prepilin peptidase [Kiritimatiellaceae bacterium]
MTDFWQMYWSGCVLILGLCFGSFLNVCIYRIPNEKSLSWPPSSCPKCNSRIQWYDNIPVLSWLILRAKCRKCKLPISVGYPLIELLTGLMFLATFLLYGWSWVTPVYCLTIFGLLLGTFIDLKYMILPDRVTIGGMVLAPVFSYFIPHLHGYGLDRLDALKSSLIGLAVGFVLFWTIRKLGTLAFKKEAMGFGDVKLMGALGALFGWQSILFITFFSALVGTVVSLGLMGLSRKGLDSQVPFGPFLTLSAFFWMFGGFHLWDAYCAFSGF